MACTVAFSCWACASAFGALTRPLERTFGTLSNPQGIGIDTSSGAPSSGDVYVADTGDARVQAFTGEGVFRLMFGDKVNKTAVELNGTPAEQDVCTALSGDECEAGTAGSELGAFTTAKFVAVDDDATSASFHDVYVADTGDGIVSKFTPEGALVKSWGTGGQLNGSSTPATTFGEIAGIAVGATGTLYVFNTLNQVFEFEPKSTFVSEVKLKTEFEGVTQAGFVVDSAGNLFKVTGAEVILESDPSGAEIGFVEDSGALAVSALAFGPDGGLYFADAAGAIEHDAFNGSGEVLEPGGGTCAVTPPAECGTSDSVEIGFKGSGIAESSGGDTFVSNPENGKVYELAPLVLAPTVTTAVASAVGPRAMTLNGTVDPKGVALTKCQFEYVEAAHYEPAAANPYAAGQVAACEAPDAAEVGSVEETVEVHARVEGLSPGVTYHFRLVAANKDDEAHPQPGADASAGTLPPPSIDSATATELLAKGSAASPEVTAVLNAEINPHGTETHYHFEYAASPFPTGEAKRLPPLEAEDPAIEAGGSDVAVHMPVVKLEAGKRYYWRVTATNASGTTTSTQHTFTYEVAGGGLPDGRAYEMVTPDHKNGAWIGNVALGLPDDIATNGSQMIATSVQCFSAAESCNAQSANSVGSPYEFTRTSAGWVATSLAPPAPLFKEGVAWAYDANLGKAIFSMPTEPAGEDDLYEREAGGAHEGLAGTFTRIGPVTPPELGALGPVGGTPGAVSDAYTADFSHFAWDSPQAWPPAEASAGVEWVYEYTKPGSAPLQVGVTGGEESSSLISECGTSLGSISTGSVRRGAMSADGRIVFFEARTTADGEGPECPSGTGQNKGTPLPADALYARVDGGAADAHTVAISRVEAPGECGSGGSAAEVACRERVSPSECGSGAEAQEKACRENVGATSGAGFTGASEDGSKALFVSTQQLTDQASEDSTDNAAQERACTKTTGPNGCNLYMYDFDEPADKRLVDVSMGEGGAPVAGGPRVRGVVAISPDGSHVYFVARGVLTATERPGCAAEWKAAGRQGEADCHAVDGAENLYGYDEETHTTAFVAEMSARDQIEWEKAPGKPANVTPDGKFMVFVSYGQLTPDDTSASGAQQIFRYDASTGGLLRMSKGNDGFNDDGNRSAATPCALIGNDCSENAWIVPALESPTATPSMSDDGSRVFFESPVGLTVHALDDSLLGEGVEANVPNYAQNVYEWEQAGVGSCPASNAAGCVYLISAPDASPENTTPKGCESRFAPASAVCLLGTDASGDNVFFTTDNQLVRTDDNTELDYYDARVCEPEHGNPCIEAPPPPPPPGCSETECHGAAAATPSAPNAPTTSINGAGNAAPAASTPKKPTPKEVLAKALKTCRAKHKHSKRKRVACERQARKKYGPKHSHQSSKGKSSSMSSPLAMGRERRTK